MWLSNFKLDCWRRFNGDTMATVPKDFYDAGIRMKHPIAIQPEDGGGGETANYDGMGWGYWQYPTIPMVDTWKWLDARRMTNVCERFVLHDPCMFLWLTDARARAQPRP